MAFLASQFPPQPETLSALESKCQLGYSYVRCLAPEDGQGSGPARQPGKPRPLYGNRRKASKGPNRLGQVLQNPHSWVPWPAARAGKSHRRLLSKGHRTRACKGLRKGGRTLYAFFDSGQGARGSKTVEGPGLPPLAQATPGFSAMAGLAECRHRLHPGMDLLHRLSSLPTVRSRRIQRRPSEDSAQAPESSLVVCGVARGSHNLATNLSGGSRLDASRRSGTAPTLQGPKTKRLLDSTPQTNLQTGAELRV